MNYKTTVFLSIALGAVLLIAAIAGMRYMNPAPEGYRSSFETAKEQTTPQPTQTATPKPTEEPFTGFYDTEAMTLKERIHTPEGFHREEVETDSFAAFMENYALYKDATMDALPKFKFNGALIRDFKEVLMPEISPLIES